MKSRPVAWLATCLTAGIIAGVAWPPPPIPRSRQIADEVAQLPSAEQLSRFSADSFQEARTNAKWLGDKSEGSPSGSGEWKLAGILTSATPAILVLKSGAGEIDRFVTGSTLPDGSRLISIDRGKVTTELDSCRRVYQMYRDRPVETSAECGDPTSNTEQEQVKP